jgi:hypothetical protein
MRPNTTSSYHYYKQKNIEKNNISGIYYWLDTLLSLQKKRLNTLFF